MTESDFFDEEEMVDEDTYESKFDIMNLNCVKNMSVIKKDGNNLAIAFSNVTMQIPDTNIFNKCDLKTVDKNSRQFFVEKTCDHDYETVLVTTRAADEGKTIRNTCRKCGFVTTRNVKN